MQQVSDRSWMRQLGTDPAVVEELATCSTSRAARSALVVSVTAIPSSNTANAVQ